MSDKQCAVIALIALGSLLLGYLVGYLGCRFDNELKKSKEYRP